ncbi:MAG: class I SAM-dependent methyltransferase [Verrucomicrobiota bacterium]
MTHVNEAIKDPNLDVGPVYEIQTKAFGVFDYPFLTEMITKGGGKRVLDVGTGEGSFLIGLARRCSGSFFQGIDINEKLIEKGKANSARLGVSVDFSSLQFGVDPVGSDFDLILARFALEHLRDEDGMAAFLNQAYEKLAENGTIVIIEYYISDLDVEDGIWGEFRAREMATYRKAGIHPRVASKLPSRLKAANFRNVRSTINHISPSTVGDRNFYSLVIEFTKIYRQISRETWPEKVVDEILNWCEARQPVGEPVFFTTHTVGEKFNELSQGSNIDRSGLKTALPRK